MSQKKVMLVYSLKNTFVLNLSINQNSVEFVLEAEKVDNYFISKALVFENDLIKDRKFKEHISTIRYRLRSCQRRRR